jgi:hypothetical protein
MSGHRANKGPCIDVPNLADSSSGTRRNQQAGSFMFSARTNQDDPEFHPDAMAGAVTLELRRALRFFQNYVTLLDYSSAVFNDPF